LAINQLNNEINTNIKKAGEHLIEAAKHQYRVMSDRALGAAAVIAGTTLYLLANKYELYYLIVGGTLGVCFNISAILHQAKANKYLRKAGKLLA
jgi:site-specific recombinase